MRGGARGKGAGARGQGGCGAVADAVGALGVGGGGGGAGGGEGDGGVTQDQAVTSKERGNEMFKARRFQDAIMYYDQAVECDPDNPVYLLNQ